MSGARLLDFGSVPNFGNLDFPNLAERVESHLASIRTLPDLERLIKSLNPLLKDEHFSQDERAVLKRLRQRAYDRRRHPNFQNPKSMTTIGSKSKIQTPRSEAKMAKQDELPKLAIAKNLDAPKVLPSPGIAMPTQTIEKIIPQPKRETFAQGALRALTSIDGEQFVKTAPKLLVWFTASLLVSFFLWQQSITLYETADFGNALYSAAGGILMIVGFAAYHAISRSWLALLLCVYAGAYEGYLMVSGTFNNESHAQVIDVQRNPELVFLEERASKEHNRYVELKQRYDNPESKVFKNDWFLKNHVDPAWAASAKAHEELIAKKEALMANTNTEHVTWLKIFYRLGLVFLCMVLVHRFFASCVAHKANRNGLESHA